MAKKSASAKNDALRSLPSVTVLLDSEPLRKAAEEFGQPAVTSATREAVDNLRLVVHQGQGGTKMPSPKELAEQIATQLSAQEANTIQPVINATGILLHTGLGRAPMAQEAAEAAGQAARGYCNVELNLMTGQRWQRSKIVEHLLCELTGAEAAHVVNNNAGATGLILATLAMGREVIVSHGELIEIGGGFRVPDVITAYGATLRPVGTTNRTRVDDYAAAISEQTGAMLVVHPSNFRVEGFTESPDLGELADLAKEHQVPLVHDIGSGALIDFKQFGCADEPIASESIQAGADLVFFSGDKLLGGPQCGIIVGRRDLVEQVMKHPLSRALRVDKITLAALLATLKIYRDPEKARQSIPLLRFLSLPLDKLKKRTERLAKQLQAKLKDWEIKTNEDETFVGGGTLPQQGVLSWSLTIGLSGKGLSEKGSAESRVKKLAERLRMGKPAVVGRIQSDQLILSLHGVFEEQDEQLEQAILAAVTGDCAR